MKTFNPKKNIFLHFPNFVIILDSPDGKTDPDCCCCADTEYSDPSELQEKLERLNQIMGSSGAATEVWTGQQGNTRRMQYLSNSEYRTLVYLHTGPRC